MRKKRDIQRQKRRRRESLFKRKRRKKREKKGSTELNLNSHPPPTLAVCHYPDSTHQRPYYPFLTRHPSPRSLVKAVVATLRRSDIVPTAPKTRAAVPSKVDPGSQRPTFSRTSWTSWRWQGKWRPSRSLGSTAGTSQTWPTTTEPRSRWSRMVGSRPRGVFPETRSLPPTLGILQRAIEGPRRRPGCVRCRTRRRTLACWLNRLRPEGKTSTCGDRALGDGWW